MLENVVKKSCVKEKSFLIMQAYMYNNNVICVFKGAQVWDFWPIFFYTNKSYMGTWLEDWRKKKFSSKTTADIRHFIFFTQAECALKKCLRRLSLR